MPDYAIEVDVGEASHKKEQEEQGNGRLDCTTSGWSRFHISWTVDTHPELQVRTEKGESRRKIIVAV